MASRKIQIRGQEVTFSSRRLSSGETAYYRSGRRQTTSYGIRVAKAVLAGQSLAEARGHSFDRFRKSQLTRVQIAEQEEFHLEAWAEPPNRSKRASEKAAYYVKVSVTSESSRRVGSPDGTEEACVPRTLALRDPDRNEQEGFILADLKRRFERVVRFTVESYGFTLCAGDLAQDLITFWRHSRR